MPISFESGENVGAPDRALRIGLVNNMPDEALKATERQFAGLLNAASEGMAVRLSFYTLPGIPRGPVVERHVENLYADIDSLWDGQLDGLIVTGREPLAARLEDEPYWKSFTRLLAWARENASSTIWSCLAAHAAILHMDGIARMRRKNKLFGIFDCRQAGDHGLTSAAPATIRLPHSRWNGIPEDRLLDRGYEVLTRGPEVGVDTFIKQEKKLFVFFQGHPEYASDTLSREYRRDVTRYVRGEIGHYPSPPANYFSASTTERLAAIQAGAIKAPHPGLLTEVAAELEASVIENTWEQSATAIYKNWLKYLNVQKEAGPQATATPLALDLAPVC